MGLLGYQSYMYTAKLQCIHYTFSHFLQCKLITLAASTK